MHTINNLGESELHELPRSASDSGIEPTQQRINDLGSSVLHEISGSPATDAIRYEELHIGSDAAPWGGGGSSGAVVSPTAELGQSAYQMARAPETDHPE